MGVRYKNPSAYTTHPLLQKSFPPQPASCRGEMAHEPPSEVDGVDGQIKHLPFRRYLPTDNSVKEGVDGCISKDELPAVQRTALRIKSKNSKETSITIQGYIIIL